MATAKHFPETWRITFNLIHFVGLLFSYLIKIKQVTLAEFWRGFQSCSVFSLKTGGKSETQWNVKAIIIGAAEENEKLPPFWPLLDTLSKKLFLYFICDTSHSLVKWWRKRGESRGYKNIAAILEILWGEYLLPDTLPIVIYLIILFTCYSVTVL